MLPYLRSEVFLNYMALKLRKMIFGKIWGSVLATRLYWAQPALVKPDYAKP
ncbi:hypothetical protein M780_00110 [Neisseria gonorrhoeae MU_NG14]|nr:hypothetical protein M780_00110 [Neisseria gonorrhoeae MU_NG14]